MPRFPERILDVVVYLFPDEESASKNDPSGGSGFLVGKSMTYRGANLHHIYAVTAKHNITRGRSPAIRTNTKDGWKVIPFKEGDWIVHATDDIAILKMPRMDLSSDLVRYIHIDNFITEEAIEEFGIGIGDPIFWAGRFITMQGDYQNIPTFRMGHLAAKLQDVLVDGSGKTQEGFFVESFSYGGYSGSPVWVYIPEFLQRDRVRVQKTKFTGPWLLGVDWGHAPVPIRKADNSNLKIDDEVVRVNSGMMHVVPAWKIKELLDLPELIKEEEAAEKKAKKLIDETIELDEEAQKKVIGEQAAVQDNDSAQAKRTAKRKEGTNGD